MKSKPITILLVEDNRDHVEITVKAFTDLDGAENHIKVVTDGEGALAYLYHRGKYADLRKYPVPDMILLDIKLPKIDGFGVLRSIKSDPKLKKIPVVILSTSENRDDIIKAYSEGANSYISKPVTFREFVDKIGSLKIYWAETNKLP